MHIKELFSNKFLWFIINKYFLCMHILYTYAYMVTQKSLGDKRVMTKTTLRSVRPVKWLRGTWTCLHSDILGSLPPEPHDGRGNWLHSATPCSHSSSHAQNTQMRTIKKYNFGNLDISPSLQQNVILSQVWGPNPQNQGSNWTERPLEALGRNSSCGSYSSLLFKQSRMILPWSHLHRFWGKMWICVFEPTCQPTTLTHRCSSWPIWVAAHTVLVSFVVSLTQAWVIWKREPRLR